jgi:hypothetical protein
VGVGKYVLECLERVNTFKKCVVFFDVGRENTHGVMFRIEKLLDVFIEEVIKYTGTPKRLNRVEENQ